MKPLFRTIPLGACPNRLKSDFLSVTINLMNMDDQRTLDVRFSLVTEPAGENIKADNAYWTNRPECVKRTWVKKVTNPPVEGTERWFHVEFDLTSMLDANPPGSKEEHQP